MKKVCQISILLYIILFRNNVDVGAQLSGTHPELYTIEQGLSQTGINHILSDSKGYLWLATQDGLNRYDGNGFKLYKHQPLDTNSLCDNYVRKLFEDKSGQIWIATANGLSCFDPRTNLFANYYNEPDKSNSLSNNSVYRVYQDRAGTIWVKTIDALEKFDSKTHSFTHYFHYNNLFNLISGDFYFDIFEDSSGKLWVGTKDGLNCFDKNLELFEHFANIPGNNNSLSNNKIKSIREDNSGNLWVGTENGLNIFNKRTKTCKRLFAEAGNANSLIDNQVNDIYINGDGYMWISTMNGFCTYNTKTNSFKQFPSIYFQNNNVSITGISTILKDNSDILWIGSYQGLVKIDMKPPKFKLFRKEENAPLNIDAYDISSVYADNDNNIWLGTWYNGLIKTSAKGATAVHYNTRNQPALHDNTVYVILPDSAGNLWLGTGNGLTLKLRSGTFQNLCDINKDCGVFENNRIYAMLADRQNTLWIATEHGLHTYNRTTNVLQTYLMLPDSQGVNIHSAYCLTLDKKGNLWIGTDNGLVKYNPLTKAFKNYRKSRKSGVNGLCSNTIYALLCTANNTIWIGTNTGLCRYVEKTETFELYTEREGLPNNMIYALLEDNNRNIWISTNKGLVQYNTKTELFTDFDIADGLQSYEFNFGAAYKTKNGELFFGGIKGYNAFYPDSLVVKNAKHKIQITSVEIIGKGIRKNIPVWEGRTIKITPDVHMFTISFAVLDFTYPANNQYMYMITSEGEESIWINNGNHNFIPFSNLPAGKYTFKVRGSNSDQIWSENEYEIHLVIESPVWKTKWAIFIYIVFFLSFGYFSVQWRTRKLRQANKELLDKEQAALKISEQKEELTIKNKNITDSINYAKRIQVAMMPSEKTFRRLLPNSFVYHKPKDIVSGDFYWIYERHGKVFVAAVDCTGHGVPGAFMSILGVELFRRITLESIEDPGKILSKLNEDFSRIFSDIEDISLKDGMDIAFCVINKKQYSLDFAGAFNPLYIVRDNKLEEVKGNRFSVSMEKKIEKLEFVTHSIELQKNDMFYIFSDGYADQFGGYEGKKFKYRRFRHLLLNIHRLPLESQKKYLDESMDSWKGMHEQVDDILVIGIKANFDE